jgi:glycosyltransferase involved in cell wall biosynthesis
MSDIAVIMPTFNRARLIPAALDSVLAQTVVQNPGAGGRRIEVAIVDDGSTDDTAQVLAPYLERHADPAGPVCIHYMPRPRQGVVAARNHAIAHTQGAYLAFLDSDDYWHPEKLALQLAAMESDPRIGPRIGLVHTSFRYVDEAGTITDDGPQRPDNPCVGSCVDALLWEFLVIFSSVLVRRSVVEAAARAEPHGQPFDPRWTNAQDYDLVLRVARLCRFACLPEALTYYRVHGAHGAMGNLKRAYGFHSRVQMDFAKRYGVEVGVDESAARQRAAKFVLGLAEAAFWRRQFPVVKDLCDLARELGFHDERFAGLESKIARPGWMYAVKDALDRWRGR